MGHSSLSSPARGATAPVVTAIALLLAASVSAQEPTWLREFGGSSDEGASALLMVEPAKVVVAGGTLGSLFGPSFGLQDVYLAWFDDAGNLIVGVQFGTSSGENASALAPAPDDGVYVAGFTGGNFGAPPAGQGDAWVARRDSTGGPVWVRQLGTPSMDVATVLCSDGVGGVVGGGWTFGGSLGGPNAGALDTWVARYDADGERLWLIQFGTPSNDNPVGISPDGAGGFFIGGSTSGDLFGPQAGEPDAWIARFDANGRLLWGRQIGTAQWDTGRALSSDGLGGAFLAGSTNGLMAGSVNGGAWLARYDTRGAQQSIIQFGGGAAGDVEAMSPDGLGGAFLAGLTNGSFGGPSAGSADVWIAHIQGGTNVAWIDQFGSSAYESPSALALAGPGSVFAAGYTQGTFAPGGGGFNDAWLARYDLCYPDCTGDGAQTVADFGCFQGKYVLGDPYADCNASGNLTIADFGCFQNKYVLGCP
ncbi:MAG: hypothetical protein ACKVU4_00455 [Phycisphaerales bacterium]